MAPAYTLETISKVLQESDTPMTAEAIRKAHNIQNDKNGVSALLTMLIRRGLVNRHRSKFAQPERYSWRKQV